MDSMALESLTILDDEYNIAMEGAIINSIGNSGIGRKIKKLFRLKSHGNDEEANKLANEIKEECAETSNEAKKLKNAKIARNILAGTTAAAAVVAVIMGIKAHKSGQQNQQLRAQVNSANAQSSELSKQLANEKVYNSINRSRLEMARDQASRFRDGQIKTNQVAQDLYKKLDVSEAEILNLKKQKAVSDQELSALKAKLDSFSKVQMELRKLATDEHGGSSVAHGLATANDLAAIKRGENAADMAAIFDFLGIRPNTNYHVYSTTIAAARAAGKHE